MTTSKRPSADQVLPGQLRVEPTERRVRGLVAGVPVVDSISARLVYQAGRHPTYYFPLDDLGSSLLVPSSHVTDSAQRGPARYWHLQVADRRVPDAVWQYHRPPAGAEQLAGLVRVAWAAMDSWWEEDEEIFSYPRDPYRRVDALASSRHVEVLVIGHVVADTVRPTLLSETGLPTRYYLPPTDVDLTLLQPTTTVTGCQYKGQARYWNVRVDGRVLPDAAWSYPAPIPAVSAIAGPVAFDGEDVEHRIDGRPQPRPRYHPAWLNPALPAATAEEPTP